MTDMRKDEIWVFAYGSSMWRPEFEFAISEPALLRGYHRAFCIYSHEYRGSPNNPGLVLGFDAGGSYVGRWFRLRPDAATNILAQIYAREMAYEAYVTRKLPIVLTRREDKLRVPLAHTHTADRACAEYAGKLSYNMTVELIRDGRGILGEGRQYLPNTIHHLRQLRLPVTSLKGLLKAVNAEG